MSGKQKTGTILDYRGDGPNDPDAPAFNPGWRDAEHEQGISFKAPWEDPYGGFPEHARRCARALADTGIPVHLRSIDPSMQWHQRFEIGGRDVDSMLESYKDLLHCSVKNYLVEVCQVVADDAMLQRLVTHRFMEPKELAMVNRFKVISTVFERDRVSSDAARCLNLVGQVWVANPTDREMLIRSGVEEAKIRVVPIPHFPDDPLLAFRGRSRQPGPVRFYHIGKWEHRKAHHELLGAFMMAFAPGEAKLYFKTSTFAPDFGEYPGSPEASIQRWLEEPYIKHRWDLRAANENIFIMKRRLSADQIRELHRIGDVYLSLSRGEGFDMPAYDASLAGNLLVYTPSGGPQSFASPQDVRVDVSGTVLCHPFYRWGDARYLDWSVMVAGVAIREAKNKIDFGWKRAGHDLSAMSAANVGASMRKYLDEVVENGTPK